MKKIFCFVVITACLYACDNHRNTDKKYNADELFAQHDSVLAHCQEQTDTISIRYAKGLRVEYREDGVHVHISNPDPKARMKGEEEFVVTAPSRRFICTTALQLGNFEVLALEDRIVGMNTLRHLFSPRMKEQLRSGQTQSIGKEGNFDVETVIAQRPDYIFVSASKHGGFEALRESGIPLIPHHGYKETDPLGQAEWIKLVGLLTGETRRANAVFADIERKYLQLKAEVAAATKDTLPTVISGRQLREGWYVVGGRSYMAQIFRDAGADYVMQDSEESGGESLDFETVYARGIHAQWWQTDGSFDGDFTLADLAAEDERYATMDAFKTHRVIFCNLQQTPYRELAGVQPHYLLADFVKAFHPQLLPNYTPRYYKTLK